MYPLITNKSLYYNDVFWCVHNKLTGGRCHHAEGTLASVVKKCLQGTGIQGQGWGHVYQDDSY